MRCLSIHPRRVRKMLLQWLWLNSLKHVRCVTVGSGWLKGFCMRNGFSPDRLYDLAPYWHEPGRGMARPEKSREILFVGRLREDKGLFHLLHALAWLKDLDWHLIIVGEGEQKDRVYDYIKEMGFRDRISLTGTAPQEKVGTYYVRGAFLVFPSLFPETFGIAGAEAMSAGLPVIAYNAGGISDWLAHGRNGLMVHRGDVQGLSQAIRQLLEDPKLRREMGQAARQDMSVRYSRGSHMENLYQIYEKALLTDT